MTSTTWLSVLTVVAIVLGPILALWAQRWSERRREVKARKVSLFRELMATRGTRLSSRHVEALNAIEGEFSTKKASEKKVIDAWKLYFDSLSNTPTDEALLTAHFQKRDDLFVDLLHEMSGCLGFDYDKVAIRRNLYTPIAHGEIEDDLRLIRKGMVDLLSGKRGLTTLSWLMPGPKPYPVQVLDQSTQAPAIVTDVEPPNPKQPLINTAPEPKS